MVDLRNIEYAFVSVIVLYYRAYLVVSNQIINTSGVIKSLKSLSAKTGFLVLNEHRQMFYVNTR